MSLAAASADAWRWQPHVEVWLLVAAVIGLSLYVVRVIAPKVVPPGEPIMRTGQKIALGLGILTLWLASDWPLHDLGEEYLYALHMVQHLLLSYVMPMLFLLATPVWLARLAFPTGTRSYRVLRRLSRPLVAGILFNVVTVLTHWPALVNAAVANGPLHYTVHVVLVAASVLMWMCVIGPFEEFRISSPVACLYLFIMSLLPTVPASWLIFAEGSVYDAYDTGFRLWGVSLASDQQAAGVIMKLVGGSFLWGFIAYFFLRWAFGQQSEDPAKMAATHTCRYDPPMPGALTYDEVRAAFDAAGEAPTEHPTRS